MMRDRLIELHKEAGVEWNSYLDDCLENGEEPSKSYDEFHADYFLAEGVIALPCKVGGKLYYICEGYVVTRIVELIKIYDCKIQLITTVGSVYEYDGTRWYNPKSNKTAYFSEEKVKQALRGVESKQCTQ